jgi:hypothetical protein
MEETEQEGKPFFMVETQTRGFIILSVAIPKPPIDEELLLQIQIPIKNGNYD